MEIIKISTENRKTLSYKGSPCIECKEVPAEYMVTLGGHATAICAKCLSNLKNIIPTEEKGNFTKENDTSQEESKENLRELAKPARCIAYFHGETWFECPWCEGKFEFYDAEFGRGFENTDIKEIYKHKCGNYILLR